MTMEPPGAQDERRLQQERLSREEAYYHFINSLTEEEYRLMRDGNLLGTPGEVTAEELRQRLNGAKEQLSQPQQETHQQGRDSTVGESRMSGTLGEASQGDSLLEWLNTFRRTGNTTRSGQSGNQTWRAVSRTNPNSGEFRFSLEININHERLEPGEPAEPLHSVPHPDRPTRGRRPPSRRALGSATLSPTQAEISASAVGDWFRGEAPAHNPPMPLRSMPQRDLTRARWVRGQRSESGQDSTDAHLASHPRAALQVGDPWSSRTQLRRRRIRAVRPPQRSRSPLCREASEDLTYDRSTSPQSLYDRPQITSPRNSQSVDPSNHHLLSSGNPHQTALSDSQPATPQINPVDNPSLAASSIFYPTETQSSNTMDVSMETGPESRRTAHNTEISELPSQTDLPASALVGSIRRHPTIMLDLQVRRIRPGESRDRDSVASRTRSRLRMAENTVTFESDSGGFRRTISRSERAGVRTYISTIRIPLRRISETGLGEPNSAALRSILRQIMTGFGELSSLMETEADVEAGVPRTQVLHSDRGMGSQEPAQGQGDDRAEPAEEEELAQMGGAPSEGQMTGRDTNLVENGTLPILRLAHFFLLNDEEDEEHPRGLTKEQIDNLSTRTYGQAGLEADMGRACSVCISEYAQGNKLRRLPCSHEFHVHCIDRWLSENNTCPICRQSVLHAHRG